MIAYDLKCINGHTFEGWFEDAQSYEKQQKEGLLVCPVCNHSDVTKILSTFTIGGGEVVGASKPPQADIDINKLGRSIVDYVENNFDNVGADFAEEALKMHYGVVEPRSIRGVSTEAEEKTLAKEGIRFFKFPTLPALKDSSADSDE